eukprot:676395-Amphidinium_carterae.1
MIYENRIGQKHKYNSENKSYETQNYWSSTRISHRKLSTCVVRVAKYQQATLSTLQTQDMDTTTSIQ